MKPRWNYEALTPMQLAQKQANKYVCTECGRVAQVFSDLPGGFSYIRCALHPEAELDPRRYVVSDKSYQHYRSETEERLTPARDTTPLLPQTPEEWAKTINDYFG